LGVFRATGALVARAKITLRVVRGAFVERGSFLSTLPGALGAMRRDEDPVACQSVVPTVGMLILVHDCRPFP
jgi:hypothetical protein